MSAEIIGYHVSLDDLVNREFHHRYQNSLQLIVSAAECLICRNASQDFTLSSLNRIKFRVATMARIHSLLSADLKHEAGLAQICVELCDAVVAAHDPQRNAVFRAISPPPMCTAAARGLLLILHELMTNALKHGAAGSDVEVEIDAPSAKLCRVRIYNVFVPFNTGNGTPRIAYELATALGGRLETQLEGKFKVTALLPSGAASDPLIALTN